jgi:mRNA interferase RelE/StbE
VKTITFTAAAGRQWARLAPDVRRRIDKRLTEFATTGHGDIRRLRGRAGARLRIGDWRVIFDERRNEVVVMAVGHRREVYE